MIRLVPVIFAKILKELFFYEDQELSLRCFVLLGLSRPFTNSHGCMSGCNILRESKKCENSSDGHWCDWIYTNLVQCGVLSVMHVFTMVYTGEQFRK